MARRRTDGGRGAPEGLEALRREHDPGAIQLRLESGPKQSYLRDLVFGAVDGTITTFAVVAGAEGAQLSAGIVIVLGLANLLGDGFSMAAGNYLAVRSEEEVREQRREVELDHIRRVPEGEREEVRQIFARKGYEGEELEVVVGHVCSNVERWVETMLQEEYGMPAAGPSAHKAAGATFASFVVAGAIPLLAFLPGVFAGGQLEIGHPFRWSAVLTALTFFTVGALKAHFVARSWWFSGLQTTAIGSLAAGIAYGVGALLRGVLAG